MMPAVRVPKRAKIARPVELRLRARWRYDEKRRAFVSETGQEFAPAKALPKHTRIVPKVPSVARAPRATLSKAERDLQRYVQVILPGNASPDAYLADIAAWPCVEEARMAPEVSLP
jgi:hypothetical protein